MSPIVAAGGRRGAPGRPTERDCTKEHATRHRAQASGRVESAISGCDGQAAYRATSPEAGDISTVYLRGRPELVDGFAELDRLVAMRSRSRPPHNEQPQMAGPVASLR
jgi:hypothetical protein